MRKRLLLDIASPKVDELNRTRLTSLARLEPWLVGAAVAVSVAWPRALPYAAGFALLFWPLRRLAFGTWSRRSPADIGIISLLALLPVTLWASALPDATVPQVLRVLTGIGLYYALLNGLQDSKNLNRFLGAVALAGIGLAFLGLFSVRWTENKVPFIPKQVYDLIPTLASDLIHRNVMAGSLIILLPPVVSLPLFAWRSIKPWMRGLLLAATAAMGVVLFLTQTRGAWLAFALTLLIVILLRWRWGWLALAAGGLGLVAADFLLSSGRIVEWLFSNEAVAGIDGRVEIWSRAVYMIQDFPFTGVGMGLFGNVADTLYPFFLAAPGTIPHAHNLFLTIAVDLGIPGLIAWLSIYSLVIYTTWRLYRAGRVANDGWVAGLGAGLLGSQIAMGVQGLVDAVTWGMVRPAPLVWLLWGLAMAAGNLYLHTGDRETVPPDHEG